MIEFIHVKGHQDNIGDIEDLEWQVKMNMYCNEIASTVLKKDTKTP